MRKINEPLLRAIAPKLSSKHREKARQSQIIQALADTMEDQFEKFGLNTKNRKAYFLAQVCHESAGFRTTEEYASGKAYEGRRDLGNTHQGDGVRFKGHGLIQVTGRANHAGFTKWCGEHFPDSPDFVETPEKLMEFPWALVSAFWYWETRKLNTYADAGDFRGATRKINGGYNGLADRRKKLARAEEALVGSTGATMLRLGAEGADVIEVQTRLKQCGYRIGAIDGDFGGLTESAARDFQADSALAVDGKVIVGGETWTALGDAVEANHMRPVVEKRLKATGKDLAGSRIVTASDKGSGAGVLVGAGTLALSYWEQAQGFMGQFADVKTLLCFAFGGLAVYLWFQLQKARAARIDDHVKGKTL